jgi:hypothetical protein
LAIGGLGGVLVLFPPFFDMRVTSPQPRGARDVFSTVPDADYRSGYSASARQASRSGATRLFRANIAGPAIRPTGGLGNGDDFDEIEINVLGRGRGHGICYKR